MSAYYIMVQFLIHTRVVFQKRGENNNLLMIVFVQSLTFVF